MKNKVQPLVISNVKFKMPLVLNESMIQKLRCTKQTSNGEESDKFEIKHLTDQGEHILSTAEIIMVDRESSNDTLSFSEACKYTKSILITLMLKYIFLVHNDKVGDC